MEKAMLQTVASGHQYWAWDSTATGPGHPEAFCHLSAASKTQPLKELVEVHELGWGRGRLSQGVTR